MTQDTLVERVARAVRQARFERNGKGAAYDPSLPLHETELADAEAAIAVLDHSQPSLNDALVERLAEPYRNKWIGDHEGMIADLHETIRAALDHSQPSLIISDVSLSKEAIEEIEKIERGGSVDGSLRVGQPSLNDALVEALTYGTLSMTKRMVVIDFEDRGRAEAMFNALSSIEGKDTHGDQGE